VASRVQAGMSSIPSFTPPSSHPQVHGHRGYRGLLPENTLPAFLHAIALGVDVVEMDVVISADHQVVVSHEPWLAAHLGRGPSGELIRPEQEQTYNIYQLPYSTIRRCVVGEWPSPSFPSQQPVSTYRPLLREVLDACESTCHRLQRPPVGYSIEIKSEPGGDEIFHPAPARFTELVLAEIQAAGIASRTTVLSFDPRILRAVRQLAPTQALCLLSEVSFNATTLFAELGFEPEVFGPDFRLLSSALVGSLASTYPNLELVPWTVNELHDLKQAIAWGVRGITTDYPNRLLHLLQQPT
jgi:glycerophosphoryl diester phosphodiesterase